LREIQLTKGYVAQVDDEDFDRLNARCWRVRLRKGRPHEVSSGHDYSLMHREVLKAGPGDPEIDHKDGNPLNNQKSNLRFATDLQQLWNSGVRSDSRHSSYKGVQTNGPKRRTPWRARIKVLQPNGKSRCIHLGSFTDEIQAARAYDAAAVKHFGVFARVNFPQLQRSA
jgi:hypothetical protein